MPWPDDDRQSVVVASWGADWGSPNLGSQRGHPLATLSESLQSSASSLVLHARDNAGVQRLVSNYEIWESGLRTQCEARQRLAAGLTQPSALRPFAPTGTDDWHTFLRGGTAVSMKRSVSLDNGYRTGSNPFNLYEATSSSFPIDGMLGQRMTVRKLLPHAPPPPSLQQLSAALNPEVAARNLEAVATSIIQGGKLAMRSAHSSMQETANNCQQNLSTLQSLLQSGLASSSSSSAASASAVSAHSALVPHLVSGGIVPVPWSPQPAATSHEDALTRGQDVGALVPWAPQLLVANCEEGQVGAAQWFAPLRQAMESLDSVREGGALQRLRQPSLRDPGRQVAIVTTASLPWMTGTSVNPLLRAAYLANDSGRAVTLVLPWLSRSDQERVFPNNMTFESPEAQEEYVRTWARKRTGLACNFKVTFYPGRYAAEKGSILPVGDVTSCIPDSEADVAVLEEPEHLNWYHHGRRWTDKFNHVVGVMHTNYLDYARREDGGALKEIVLRHINAWVCRVHCHKVVKLSDAVQALPRQETMFVHGVSPAFLEVGERKALQATAADQEGEEDQLARSSSSGAPDVEGPASALVPLPRPPTWGKGAYFLGKVLWAKGYTELLDRLNEHASSSGTNVSVDVFGSGPDLQAVEDEAGRRRLNLSFNAGRDHADESLQEYKVFINPSLSDVVATTTAEALAMGKFVVCADHPSNRFFKEFPNCLVYRDSAEFSQCLQHAMEAEPEPLTAADLHKLTWEAATERFLDVAEARTRRPLLESALDNVLHLVHNTLTGVESVRRVAGAGTGTRDMPACIADYQPCQEDLGGMFDNHGRAREQLQVARPPPPSVTVVECVSHSLPHSVPVALSPDVSPGGSPRAASPRSADLSDDSAAEAPWQGDAWVVAEPLPGAAKPQGRWRRGVRAAAAFVAATRGRRKKVSMA